MKYLSAGLLIEALTAVSEQDDSLSYELFEEKVRGLKIITVLNVSLFLISRVS